MDIQEIRNRQRQYDELFIYIYIYIYSYMCVYISSSCWVFFSGLCMLLCCVRLHAARLSSFSFFCFRYSQLGKLLDSLASVSQ